MVINLSHELHFSVVPAIFEKITAEIRFDTKLTEKVAFISRNLNELKTHIKYIGMRPDS